MKEFNPSFDDLFDPETWHANDDLNGKELAAKKGQNDNPFPVEVFPEDIQEIIIATMECLNFPIDFTGVSMLFALSVAIGNTHRVEIMPGWTENAVLYIILIGSPGTNKSHPLSMAIKPLHDADKHTYREYIAAKKEYDQIEKMSKSEKKASGKSDLAEPFWHQHLVSDSTPEALAQVHQNNPRGIGVYHDEVASWTKNFGRYNSGSEEQFWLSNWSGKHVTINRKIAGNVFIPFPFIPVIGTIQPGVLRDFAPSKGIDNGFHDRILNAFPSALKKEPWSEKEIDPDLIRRWHKIISVLLRIPTRCDIYGDLDPKILKLAPNAKELLFQWQWGLTNRSNESGEDGVRAIYSKMEMYAARLALILEMAQYGCSGNAENAPDAITIDSVKGAIKLVEYFIKTALKVRDIVSNADPLAGLSDDKRALYNSLPDEFTTEKGVKISKEIGALQERATKEFFNNKDLFKRVKHGRYEKI